MRAVALLVLAAACGGGSTAGMRLAFEEADVAKAQRAPDLLARAQEARDRAEAAAAAGDEDAAADYATEARLWLRAAVVEADRLDLEAARLEDEREEEVVAQRLAETRAERRAREATLGRERAAAVAREQMERAFAAAEQRETQRPSPMDPMTAARAFLDRARLLTATARALRAPAEATAALLATLEAAPTTRDGTQALREALSLHRQALTLLGQARAASPVTPRLIASFVEAAKERGLEVSLTPDGAFVSIERDDATKMADLMREFPHGPLRIQGRGARRFHRELGSQEGVRRGRLSSEEAAGDLSVQLPAYGTEAGLPADAAVESPPVEAAPDAG